MSEKKMRQARKIFVRLIMTGRPQRLKRVKQAVRGRTEAAAAARLLVEGK